MHPFDRLVVPAGALGIHWFEQNAYAIKDSRGVTMLIDPYFPSERPPDRFIRSEAPLVESELPTSLVLVTHRHGDHTNPETLSRIHAAWPKAQYIGPVEAVGQIVAETDIDASLTHIIAAGETQELCGYAISAFHSKPPNGDPSESIAPPDVAHLGYVVASKGPTLYVTGDAINTLSKHDDILGEISALKPEIGLITTHPTEGEFPFFEGSIELAIKLGLKAAVPSHYACFVKRTYDPLEWAAMFPSEGPKPCVIPWNSHTVYPPRH